jgi:hypothetical protein
MDQEQNTTAPVGAPILDSPKTISSSSAESGLHRDRDGCLLKKIGSGHYQVVGGRPLPPEPNKPFAPKCDVCRKPIGDPATDGGLTLTARREILDKKNITVILKGPRFVIHHRSPECAPEDFIWWQPLDVVETPAKCLSTIVMIGLGGFRGLFESRAVIRLINRLGYGRDVLPRTWPLSLRQAV